MTDTAARSYRLTRPDGLGFFHHRSAGQFAIGCLGIGLGVLSFVLHQSGLPPRIFLACAAVLVLVIATARTPDGEDALELLPQLLAYCNSKMRGQHRFATALLPSREVGLPPLFAGITLLDVKNDASGDDPLAATGLIVDRVDSSASVVLRVHGEGFLLAEPSEQDARLQAFGDALASLESDNGVIRIAWSQFVGPALSEVHLGYLEAAARSDVEVAMRDSYLSMLDATIAEASRVEVLVTITTPLLATRGREARDERTRAAAARLQTACEVFSGALLRGGLVASGPLPAGAIARALRDRLDPSATRFLARRHVLLGAHLGLLSKENGFPLSIVEHHDAIETDDSWHRIFRVAEWPRVAVRADWLASFLCESTLTRSFTVVFSPQSRQSARRQAGAVATRVSASIDERERKGRRVSAEEHNAQAAEALDTELEAGAAMELVIGLVDVTASQRAELEQACEKVRQSAANIGIELRKVSYRQGAALLASLPLGRVVSGRAR